MLSTGNEICAVEPTPAPGRCATSTSTVLGAQVELCGAVATYGGMVRDDEAELAATIARLLPATMA